MARVPKFPIEIQSGSVSVKIHLTPVKLNGKKYNSFTLIHYLNGKRKRVRFNDLGKAKLHAQSIAAKISNEESSALVLTADDRRMYVAACNALKEIQQPLDVAAREYATAKKILGDASLIEASKYYAKRIKTVIKSITVPEVIQELLKTKERDKASEAYLKDLRTRLRLFAEKFKVNIGDITSVEIDDWLRNLNAHPRTRNNFRRLILTLFSFAKSRHYLPKNEPTAADETTKVKVPDTETEIFQPEEMQRMLDAASLELRPFLAIGGFAGIRTAEIKRLDWKDVNFEQKHIEIKSSQSKTQSRRIVPLSPNLLKWLEPYKNQTGRIMGWGRVERTASTHSEKLGIQWKTNALRHSYGSYRLAEIKNAAQVSLEMGNSPQMVFKHYRELVTETQAAKWWSIMPNIK